MRIALTLASVLIVASAFGQDWAPKSMNGISFTWEYLGGNRAEVSPGVRWTSASSGIGETLYSETSYEGYNSTATQDRNYGTYTYEVDGNVGFIDAIGADPAVPMIPGTATLTFTSPTGGTFEGVWGNATNFGTFTISSTIESGPLINISARIDLTPGQVIIPGFVVGDPIARKVLVRAAGTALTGLVESPIPSTTLTVFSGSESVASNTGWTNGAAEDVEAVSAAITAAGAFEFEDGSADSAILLTLEPGEYTVHVSAANETDEGTLLVEVYFVP